MGLAQSATFFAQSCWFPVWRDEGVKWRDWMKEERRGGMSGDERSQRRGEQTDRYGN